MGSSFLAEGFADYGYAGVLLVAVSYGLLVAWIDAFVPGSVLANTMRLLSIPAIVFAPRGSDSGFLADVLSPVTLAVLLGTWLVALLLKDRRREGAQRVTPRVVAPARVGHPLDERRNAGGRLLRLGVGHGNLRFPILVPPAQSCQRAQAFTPRAGPGRG